VDPVLVTVDGTSAVQAVARLDPAMRLASTLVGMTAEVEVIAAEARDVLLVPVEALRELPSGQFGVFIVKAGGELELRPVAVGLDDFVNAEILSGLELGDTVSLGEE
jgi:multidrug efflux pump subunit AcrA (membrane-fusion protein)